jgi:hypothetical protein
MTAPSDRWDLNGSRMHVFQGLSTYELVSVNAILLSSPISHGGTNVGKTKPIWPSLISNLT